MAIKLQRTAAIMHQLFAGNHSFVSISAKEIVYPVIVTHNRSVLLFNNSWPLNIFYFQWLVFFNHQGIVSFLDSFEATTAVADKHTHLLFSVYPIKISDFFPYNTR